MTLLSFALAAALGATPVVLDQRPLWGGPLAPGAEPVLVASTPAGLLVRSSGATLAPGGDLSQALGAGLCPGIAPRLGIPAGSRLFLLGPGAPATLLATAVLPSQAVSAAVPVTTAAGCLLAVALQSGDLALVDATGAVTLVGALLQPIRDWHELPRGLLIASRGDLVVVGGLDGGLAAVQLGDGKRFAGTAASAPVPGAVWSDGEAALWFLGKDGALQGWRVTTGTPMVLHAGGVAAPGGLVAWGGKSDHGIAWADMQGQLHAWKDGVVRQLVRLPAAVRWPLLVADLDDTGDLSLVAAVDGQVAALVTEEAQASFRLIPLARRPVGAPVIYQLAPDQPPVLAIPAGLTSGAFHPGDGAPAGQLLWDGAILTDGAQLAGTSGGAMHAALVLPPESGGGGGGGAVPPGVTPSRGFSCATAPAEDALPLLLLPLLLLAIRRRRRPLPQRGPAQGVSGDWSETER
jgi:MYXO-CTERM domain-containing protein